MKIDLSQFRQSFLQESADHVAAMETGLLELRSAPADVELLNGIFRSAHSIKGGAGSFGMTNLVRFTHSLENLLDRLRELEMQATDEVIDVLLRSVDVLRGLLEADADAAMPAEALALDRSIVALMSGDGEPAEAASKDSAQEDLPQPETDGREVSCAGRSGSVAVLPELDGGAGQRLRGSRAARGL
jgi:two-component system, chemotaxis family, sensor kinase CheA